MRTRIVALTVVILVVGAVGILWASGIVSLPAPNLPHGRPTPAGKPSGPLAAGHQQATLGNGCFWCTEAVFQQVNGVQSVMSGYSGGSVKDPTYEAVCTGETGHAEVIQIVYDPAVVSFTQILEVFWKTHDPTTRNRQGHDIGTQYRSVVFYHTEEQKQIADQHKQKLDAAKVFDRPIVTEIVPFTAFYPAEAKHQNFFLDNPLQPYCAVVIRPKLEKLEQVLKEMQKLEPGAK